MTMRISRETQVVTFVGWPFPLEETPENFARLRRWGLTFSKRRLLIVSTP